MNHYEQNFSLKEIINRQQKRVANERLALEELIFETLDFNLKDVYLKAKVNNILRWEEPIQVCILSGGNPDLPSRISVSGLQMQRRVKKNELGVNCSFPEILCVAKLEGIRLAQTSLLEVIAEQVLTKLC